MMTSDFIIHVSEEDFEYEVLSYSQNTPVVVDFWASWCKPCKQLTPLLEAFAHEGHGSFRLAKVDVDANPNLAIRYGVRSIPTVKAFVGGQVVAEFVGMQPVERLREFFGNLVPPSPLSLMLEKANSLLSQHQCQEAIELFREVLEQNLETPEALLGLAKGLLVTGNVQEASHILRGFPASPQFARADALRPLAEALQSSRAGTLPDENDQDAAFANSIRLAGRGKLLLALDGLLDVLRADKHYRSDRARRVYLAILEVMGEDDPDTRQYRADLATVLF